MEISTEQVTPFTTQEEQKKQRKIEREIKRRNRLFSKATPEQKRVLIARDVLNLMKNHKIEALRQKFVYSEPIRQKCRDNNFNNEALKNFSVQKEFLNLNQPCRACALGSMMISCTLYNNKETLAEFRSHFEELGDSLFYEPNGTSRTRPNNHFAEIFSPEQLALIEVCFEACGSTGSIGFVRAQVRLERQVALGITDDVINKAEKLAVKYPEPEPRLKAIMRNIIKNKGTFVV